MRVFEKRVENLRAFMEGENLESVLLISPENVYYFSGVSSQGCLMLVTREEVLLFKPSLDMPAKTKVKADIIEMRSEGDLERALKGLKTVGVEESKMNMRFYRKFERHWRICKDVEKFVKEMRCKKDAYELGIIKKNVGITEKIFRKGIRMIEGKSEREAVNEIKILMLKHGVEHAFEPIVACGKSTIFPHPIAGGRVVKLERNLILDVGIKRSYCTDVTRSFHGERKRVKKMMEDAANIQDEIADFIASERQVNEINEFYKKLMKAKGHEVLHSPLHGIGLEVHEDMTEKIRKNAVICIEPGIYVKKIGGVRVEDMFLVKEKRLINLTKNIHPNFVD